MSSKTILGQIQIIKKINVKNVLFIVRKMLEWKIKAENSQARSIVL